MYNSIRRWASWIFFSFFDAAYYCVLRVIRNVALEGKGRT